MRSRFVVTAAIAVLLAVVLPAGSVAAAGAWRTDATYYNDAATPGADPYVLYDRASGYYYAYSTEGADDGYHFGIYRSPDLATWAHVPGGALRAGQDGDWAHDWFWAPEVYHNPTTGLYFLFYAGRMNRGVAEHFRYPDFEEASKVGVAVSRSPAGPFHDLGKYIEESNIYAVELTGDWWTDPTGATMPAIAPAYRNANLAPSDPPGTRKDGFVPILNYGSDKQEGTRSTT